MARAKQTERAEARRRYRQAVNAQATEADEGTELDYGERRPNAAPNPAGRQERSPDRPSSSRLGFLDSLRQAYHPAHVRDDLVALPMLLRSRAFLVAAAVVIVGAVALFIWPAYTGSQFAADLLIRPGSALAPQLIAGFFAPRASYILGFLVGLIQAVGFIAVISTERFQSAIEAIQPGTVAPLDAGAVLGAVLNACVAGALFAAAAAWYRRFLALSSPRRAQAGRNTDRRSRGR